MNWIALSLLAPALYACVNFIDKYVVEHKVKDSFGMPIYGTITAIIFGTAVWLLAGSPVLSARNGLLVMLSGLISMQGFALYFYALAKSHTSYIIAMLQTTPIFTLILSTLILHETLSSAQLTGFVLVFLAVIGLSVGRVERRVRFGKPFYAITLANVFFAIAAIIIKFTIDLNGFVPILAYESWGLAIGGVLLFMIFRRVRTAFLESFRAVGRPTLGVMFFNESLFIISKAITFLAISLGPVALVTVLAGTQVFYGFLYGIVLTLLFPKFFNEDVSRGGIIVKAVFSIILFTGVWFIGKA